VEFRFDSRLDGLRLSPSHAGRVQAVEVGGESVACDAVVLATGHSARDTWERLHRQGVPFEAKPFQFGVRIEHPQELVTRARYGDPAPAELGAAAYGLTHKARAGVRGAHSFCMCPGGRVVASVHEEGHLCTNGMSNSTHSSRWANSGLVVTLGPDDYGAKGPFAGVAFQRRMERLAFEAGGGTYAAPAQRADDFLARRATSGELATSLVFGARPARLDELLPEAVTRALAAGLKRWERQVPGFAGPEGLLLGFESRSSGPVRIPRDRETLLVEGFSNLQAVGEGAGWAGGIMSAAIDGARAGLALHALP